MWKCRELYLKGITPANPAQGDNPEVAALRELANEMVRRSGRQRLCGFFQESQYMVNLWAAHFVVEHTDVMDELALQALQMISEYTDTPIKPEIGIHQQNWLALNYPDFKAL